MYLKRLEIQGFKSFANKTALDFLPPKGDRFSVTAVVGPNGSGKSNIIDAIRWVLGEQSLKALRGKRSEDVIFNGSESKGRLGMAEVTLALDNADGRAGEPEEISVTRRLYRSGEGEYFVNNVPARLFDIQIILAKTQVAQNSYGIIGQGMIDQLLISSAADRRDLLDEATGVKEFQIKKHQAELKLARTAENIAQAERLLQEVEPRLRLLSRQVKKLEKRQAVEMSLREAQEQYYATLYLRHQAEIERLENELRTVEENYRNAFADLESSQNELSALARAESRQEAFVSLQTKHQTAVKEKNDLERELAIMEGRMQSEYRQVGKESVGWLEKKIQELKSGREQTAARLAAAESETERLRRQLADQQGKIDGLTVERTEKTVQISRLQSALTQNQSERDFFQFSGLSAVKAILEAKENFGGKIYGLVAELGEVGEEHRQALDAAAGGYLSAIVVEDDETAKRAIEYLRERRLGVATFLPLNKIQGRQPGADIENILKEKDVLGLAMGLVSFSSKFQNVFSYIFGDTIVVRDLTAARRVGIGRARMATLDGDLAEKRGVMKGGWRQSRGLTFSSRFSWSGEERAREFETRINLEQQNLRDLEKRLEAERQKMSSFQVELGTAENKITMLNGEEQGLVREQSGLEKELEGTRVSPEEYGALLTKLAEDKKRLLAKLSEAEAVIVAASAEVEEFNQKEEEKKQRIFSLQEAMQKKQNEVNTILSHRNELKIEAAKLETKQESLNEEARNETGTAISSIVERNPATVPAERLAELADQIQKLKYQLSLIGGIDEEVIKEHEQTRERYDFLSSQLADLKGASEDLEEMVADLDDLMKRKRETAFKKIRKEFNRYFQILFDGGHADLEEIYEEAAPEAPLGQAVEGAGETAAVEEEPIEATPKKKKEKFLAGIEVIANPPGKKIKSLNSLSGGERTLTSIALVCAILNCNPSPFVIMDEVEAALDETNTVRFTKILAELAAHTQFIIVTHNRVTMHAADALYGVTMSGDGVSKLLSVKIEEAEAGG